MADIGVKRTGNAAVVEHTGFRISWGAILAGFVVATVLQIVLSLLGIAIGLAAWDPGDPARDLGVGAGIWFVLTAIVTMLIGGLTTGRLAGILTRGDGALHGVVMWGLSTLLAAWMFISGFSFLVGGAFGILGRTVAATTGAVVGGVTQVATTAVGQAGTLDPAAIQSEIEAALMETGRPGLHPDSLRAEIEDVRRRAAARGVSNDQLAREIQATVQERAGRVDREAVINVVTARTELTRPEAERLANRVDNLAARAQQQIATTVDTVGARAQRFGEDATDAVSRAAWWALLALGLSVAAAAGGAASTARE